MMTSRKRFKGNFQELMEPQERAREREREREPDDFIETPQV